MNIKSYSSVIVILLLLVACSGEQTTYYRDGTIESVFTMNSDGKKDGLYKHYDSTGYLDKEIEYENGIRKTAKYYAKSTGLTEFGYYRDNTYQYGKIVDSTGILLTEHFTPTRWGVYEYYSNGKFSKKMYLTNILNDKGECTFVGIDSVLYYNSSGKLLGKEIITKDSMFFNFYGEEPLSRKDTSNRNYYSNLIHSLNKTDSSKVKHGSKYACTMSTEKLP